MDIESKSWVKPVAKAGLITKGLVYSLVGALAFMAAFEIGGKSNENADKKGVFNFIEEANRWANYVADCGGWFIMLRSMARRSNFFKH